MAKYADRVKETTTTTGTGDVTLAGTITGFRRLQDAFSVNDYVRYTLLDANGIGWETGYGELSSVTTLTREFPLDSSAGAGSKITLSSGTHTVMIGPHPEARKTEGLLTGLTSGSVPDSTWTDLVMGPLTPPFTPPDLYDTSGILSSSSYNIVPPAWVSRIRVDAWGALRDSSGLASGGELILIMAHTDNAWEANGMPRDSQPSTIDASNDRQTLRLASGIIDVPDNGSRGFKIRVYQTTGQTLSFTTGYCAVEYVE